MPNVAHSTYLSSVVSYFVGQAEKTFQYESCPKALQVSVRISCPVSPTLSCYNAFKTNERNRSALVRMQGKYAFCSMAMILLKVFGDRVFMRLIAAYTLSGGCDGQ
jgi:hypothetical protein